MGQLRHDSFVLLFGRERFFNQDISRLVCQQRKLHTIALLAIV